MAENNEEVGKILSNEVSDCDIFKPSNLRVLALDANIVSLRCLVVILHKCGYKVTSTTVAAEALDILRENKNEYDIVISDVVRLDMDGFKLLEIIGLEMDLPVIMVSAEDSASSIMKGIRHGARDYLLKPVRIQEIKNIWQHVVRKTLFDSSDKSSITKEIILQPEQMSTKQQNIEPNDEEEANNDQSTNGSSVVKKPRLQWHHELHVRFLEAVHMIEAKGERVHPKRIREVMNVEGLSRENIASHLQKYRNMLKKQKIRMLDQEDELKFDLKRHRENSPMKNIRHGNFANDPNARVAQKSNNSFINTNQVFIKPNQQTVLQQNLPSSSMVFQRGMLNHMPAVPVSNVLNMANNYIPAPEFKGLNYATASSSWKLPNDYIQMPSQCFGFEPSSRSMSPFLYPPASLNTPTQEMLEISQTPMNSLLSSIIGPEQHDGQSTANFHWRGTSGHTRQVNHGTHFSNESENPVLIDIPKEEEAKLFMDDEISEMVKQFHNDGVPRL